MGTDSGSGGDVTTGPGLGTDGGGAGDGGAGHVDALSVAFVPAAKTLTVDGVNPQTQTYQLVATLKAGGTVDVIPDSVQFDRPDIASAKVSSVTTLTTPGIYAGTGTLHGVYGTLSATATLSVIVNEKNLNGISTTIAGKLDAATTADPSLTSILYPYDQTVFALGLTSPLLMWNAPNAGDTYRFELSQSNYTYDVYATVGATGQFRIDQSAWDIVTASNKAAASPLTLKISRYDVASGNAYISATESFTVAPESLRGAIYYWTASKEGTTLNGHITRFRPGTGSTPVVLNNGKCMGCHAVNANGTVLIGDIDDQHEDNAANPRTDPSLGPYGNWSGTRPWASFDVSDSTSDAGATLNYETTMFGADIALTPDGTYVVFGGPTQVATGGSGISNPLPGSKNISLAYVADAGVIADSGLDGINLTAGRGIQQPAFSPDGKKLAVVVSSQSADNVIPDDTGTSIAYLTFDETGPSFGSTLSTLVNGTDAVFAAGQHGLGYPSFTPDSTAIAFQSGTHASGCTAPCDNTVVDDGSLFFQTVANGGVASPVRMTAASDNQSNASEDGLSVEPTFNPQARGGYSWVVFTSMRTWGNQPFPVGTPAGYVNGKRRLWVAAVDTTTGTTDPSHPAIYLEGQEDTPNMRGFWANAACTPTAAAGAPPNACGAGYECCSGFCVDAACVDVSKVSCAGTGASCATTGDCCNSGSVACVDGTCKAQAPR